MPPLTTRELALKVLEMEKVLNEHSVILVGKDGDPGICERLRKIEEFAKTINFWLRAIALAFLAQFMAAIVGILALFFRIYPILVQMDKTKSSGAILRQLFHF